MSYAAAVSTHPDPAVAVGEVIGEIIERLGEAPTVSSIFISDAHLGSLTDIHTSTRVLLGGSLLGCTSGSITGGAREVEGGPGISIWSTTLDDVTTFRLNSASGALRVDSDVFDRIGDGKDSTMIVIADPYSFPVDDALSQFASSAPLMPVIGGMSSPSLGPGTSRLLLDDEVHYDGAVAMIVPNGHVIPIVSQGCRPIGRPMIVTGGHGNSISHLAGQSATSRLSEIFSGLSESERLLVSESLHIGRVVDESSDTFSSGDFLIRGVLGADHSTGTIMIGDDVQIGDTVQFQVRDADSATEDLQLALWNAGEAASALVFTCNSRGSKFFDAPDHDMATIHDRLGIDAMAGMFCAGEIGPVGESSFVHGFTASMAFFR